MSEGYVSFFKAPVYFFKQAFDWKGRTSRSGYWWMFVWGMIYVAVLFYLMSHKIINADTWSLSLVAGIKTGHYGVILGTLIQLILVVPTTSLFARRTRDVAISINWAYLMAVLSVINVFVPDATIESLPVVGKIYSIANVFLGLYVLYIGIRPSQTVAGDGKTIVNK